MDVVLNALQKIIQVGGSGSSKFIMTILAIIGLNAGSAYLYEKIKNLNVDITQSDPEFEYFLMKKEFLDLFATYCGIELKQINEENFSILKSINTQLWILNSQMKTIELKTNDEIVIETSINKYTTTQQIYSEIITLINVIINKRITTNFNTTEDSYINPSIRCDDILKLLNLQNVDEIFSKCPGLKFLKNEKENEKYIFLLNSYNFVLNSFYLEKKDAKNGKVHGLDAINLISDAIKAKEDYLNSNSNSNNQLFNSILDYIREIQSSDRNEDNIQNIEKRIMNELQNHSPKQIQSQTQSTFSNYYNFINTINDDNMKKALLFAQTKNLLSRYRLQYDYLYSTKTIDTYKNALTTIQNETAMDKVLSLLSISKIVSFFQILATSVIDGFYMFYYFYSSSRYYDVSSSTKYYVSSPLVSYLLYAVKQAIYFLSLFLRHMPLSQMITALINGKYNEVFPTSDSYITETQNEIKTKKLDSLKNFDTANEFAILDSLFLNIFFRSV